MQKQNRFTVLSLAVFLALLVAAVMPLSAFAQDEVPPTDVPAAEEAVPPVVVDVVPVVGEVAPAAEEPQTVPEILEALPEGTDLVVLDEGGEALPLASQEAAEVVAAADDPFFWDGTQYVGYSTTDVCAAQVTACNTSATPLQTAINAFRDSSTATGSIYVAAGTYAANVIIDGATGNLKNLTGLIGEGSGLTTLNGFVVLQNLNIGANVFTFQGFTLANSTLQAIGNTATLNITDIQQPNAGIYDGIVIVSHNGNANLTNVSANRSASIGISISVTGNATIVDSEAANNPVRGIHVGNGTVTLNNVNIHDNSIVGVYGSAGSTVVIGCSAFDRNGAITRGSGSITFNEAAACGVKGQGKVTFPKVPSVVPPVIVPPIVIPPSGVTVFGNDNEIKNVFAPLSDQIVVVTAPSTAGDLPADLPAGKTFAAGASLTLMQGGEVVTSAPNGTQAFFDIPSGAAAPFTILFWDGTKWVEIPSQVVDGKVVFSVTTPGMYVLVTG